MHCKRNLTFLLRRSLDVYHGNLINDGVVLVGAATALSCYTTSRFLPSSLNRATVLAPHLSSGGQQKKNIIVPARCFSSGPQKKKKNRFGILRSEEEVYLEQVKEDYEDALEACSQRSSPASERFVGKFRAIYDTYTQYGEILSDMEECADMQEGSDDAALEELVRIEMRSMKGELAECYHRLQDLISHSLEDNDSDVILEVRAAAGGLEAGIFALDLYKLYRNVAAEKGIRWEELETEKKGEGGITKAVVDLSGPGAYTTFRYEAGVHRVQRVPQTEKLGRVHTSTAVVTLIKKPKDIKIVIDLDDVVIMNSKSSGSGGQFIASHLSRVQMLHKPTGIMVESQESRFNNINRSTCLKKLEKLLYRREIEKVEQKSSTAKTAQAKHGDRSDKIRTYNYTSNKVTDHRCNTVVSPHNFGVYFSDPADFLRLNSQITQWDRCRKLAAVAKRVASSDSQRTKT